MKFDAEIVVRTRRESYANSQVHPSYTMPLQIRRGFPLVAHQVLASKDEN